MSRTGGEAVTDANNWIVLDPRINVPEGWRLMMVPATVMAGPPAYMIVPAMENAEGFGVNISPATVNAVVARRVGDEVGSDIVMLPKASDPE